MYQKILTQANPTNLAQTTKLFVAFVEMEIVRITIKFYFVRCVMLLYTKSVTVYLTYLKDLGYADDVNIPLQLL